MGGQVIVNAACGLFTTVKKLFGIPSSKKHREKNNTIQCYAEKHEPSPPPLKRYMCCVFLPATSIWGTTKCRNFFEIYINLISELFTPKHHQTLLGLL